MRGGFFTGLNLPERIYFSTAPIPARVPFDDGLQRIHYQGDSGHSRELRDSMQRKSSILSVECLASVPSEIEMNA